MARILIISEFFHKIDSPRALRAKELAFELVKKGHYVYVICSLANLPEQFYSIENLVFEDLGQKKKLEFKWISILFGKRISYLISKIMLILFEYPNILLMKPVRSCLKKQSGFDLLISIGQPYPIHWGVASIWSNKIAKKWVADCGDPYALLKNDTYFKPYYFRWIEKWFMRKCDYVSIPIESARSSYFNEFSSKIVVIPQGLSFPDINTTVKSSEITISFAYFGDIYPYQKTAIRFIHLLARQTYINYKFIIYSKGTEFFLKNMDENTRKKSEIHLPIERFQLLKSLSSVDFLVYFPYEKPGQQPFKLVDYTFLNKPILCFKNDLISENVFLEFLNGNFSNKSKGVELESYKVENVAKQFLSLI